MKRSALSELARKTIDIVERGSYVATDGQTVDISHLVRDCLTETQLFQPNNLKELKQNVLARPPGEQTSFEVVNETTLEGIARVLSDGNGPVAALNFASAKNPGGGFLSGSQAQEESLARSSALYASLLQAPQFYDGHRASSSLLYSDGMILSPHCPIFRDDGGRLLNEPLVATFITSPAPNAGAIATNRRDELSKISEVLQRRSEYVLALVAAHGYRRLVLGAWGVRSFPQRSDTDRVHICESSEVWRLGRPLRSHRVFGTGYIGGEEHDQQL